MIIADQRRSATDLKDELTSLVALFENINFGSNFPIHKERPANSAARPVYKSKTYNEKTVTVENERILGLPVFTYEISLSQRFDPKKHFKQFQQFAEERWHDYALLVLTDDTIALLDLTHKKILSTVTVTGPISELHVETVSAELQGIKSLLERGKEILVICSDENSEEPADLNITVELLGIAHVGIMQRTGQKGFFTTKAKTNSPLNPEVRLGSLDLSKSSESLLEEILTDDFAYLDSEVPLRQAVTMDLTTESDFIVLEKVHRKF